MKVERLRADQWADLRGLRLAALADAPEAFWATLADEAGYHESRWRTFVTGVAWFVVRRDAEIVGAAGGVRGEGAEPELIGMWVAPGVRGRGYGAALVDAVCDWARGNGATSIGLWIVQGNGPARTLYQRCGFQPTGERTPLPSPRVGVEERLRLTW